MLTLIPKQRVQDALHGDNVDEDLIDTTRWGAIHRLVFEYEKHFYKYVYEIYPEEGIIGFKEEPLMIPCEEVKKVPVHTFTWEVVK